jgi:hypothetical protein
MTAPSVAGHNIDVSVHFAGKALSSHKLLTLLIAMRPDSWVVVKGGFLNAHPSH